MNSDAYKLKYLKYKAKYLELKDIIGGTEPDPEAAAVERAVELSRIQEEEAEEAEINIEFERRLRDARILVIGASFKNKYSKLDDIRWGRIDPNFLGVSHMSRDPIGKLGSWDNNPHEYWPKVFGEILKNRKFDAIYLDRGTFEHIVHETFNHRIPDSAYNFNYESFKILVKYIYSNKITDNFYLQLDLLNLDKRIARITPRLLERDNSPNGIDIDYYLYVRSYERSFREIIKFFYSYFKCCGDTQDIFMGLNKNVEVFKKWLLYLRK